ncbi:zinc finger CCCH domain-containing protein 7 [Phoenix dactylifera]|uniref:Zinc finger CCCH domain-containing protein 7 n=1 Tax=Phoenix dactylifera TaxID=42345 RepID=A0A8B9ATD3_PHODC|nr:zinc finger CCCH domain-containing protein 7 [Phoenix dactylifera]
MEDLVRSPAPELQTLNPRMEGFSRSASRTPRRSHLDSASYRTLVRIFSLCLDESLGRPQESRKDPNPRSDDVPESSCTGKDSIFGRSGDGNVAEEIGRGRKGEGHSGFEGSERGEFGGSERSQGSACGNPRFDDSSLNGNISSREELGHENGTSVELPEALVFEKLQSGGIKDEASHRMEELGHGSGREECDQSANGGTQKALLFTDLEHLLHENINSVEQPGNGELLNDIIFDFSGLIDNPNDLVCSAGSQDGQRQLGHGELANNELRKDVPLRNTKLADSKNQNSCSGQGKNHEPQDESSKIIFSGDKMIYSSEELLHGKMREGHGECVNDVLTKHMFPDKHMMDGVRHKEIKSVKELGEVLHEETHCCSDSLMEGSESRELAIPVLASEDSGDIEEGEIPGELNISNQDLDMVHEHAVLEDRNIEEGTTYCGSPKKGDTNMTCLDEGMHSRESNYKDDESAVPIHITKGDIMHVSGDDRYSETQMKKSYSSGMRVDVKRPAVDSEALGLPGENLGNIISQNKEKPSNHEAVEARLKRKRGALTEERKAKRKKAKKRKRAQKEREQGVKRLKLQPISKPKTVKYCNFYLMGRCQQGDLCKFSHDTTPLTKSQPCTYFARDSCLKGDDCPFDHQLSKYPCHNFSSKGMCSRGDKCKFSHKITTNEASSSIPIISKSKSPLTSENLNFRKQNTTNSTSIVACGPPKTTTSCTPFPIQKNMEGDTIKPPKIPMRIPNGIRFLSFGKGPSDSINRQHHDNLLLKERKILDQQNQEKFLMDGHKNDTDDISLAQTSLLKVHSESNVMSGGAAYSAINTLDNKNLKNKSISSVSSVVPGSRSLHSEVSDASKILEEFLFSGVS